MLTDIQKILSRLGFKESEIIVYLTCLENKQGLFVSEVAEFTRIKRSTVNLILERLLEKGVMTYHLDGSRKRFFAEAPETVLFTLEESLGELRSIIPLLNITSGQDEDTKIRFFEGKEGIEKIYADTLLTMKMNKNPKKEILAISSGEDVFQVTPEHQKSFISKRIKERIPIRWIAPEGKIARDLDKTSREEFRTIKFFDSKKYHFHIEIDVYADKIALINLRKDGGGVIVESKSLAESFRSIFNLLWDFLPS